MLDFLQVFGFIGFGVSCIDQDPSCSLWVVGLINGDFFQRKHLKKSSGVFGGINRMRPQKRISMKSGNTPKICGCSPFTGASHFSPRAVVVECMAGWTLDLD